MNINYVSLHTLHINKLKKYLQFLPKVNIKVITSVFSVEPKMYIFTSSSPKNSETPHKKWIDQWCISKVKLILPPLRLQTRAYVSLAHSREKKCVFFVHVYIWCWEVIIIIIIIRHICMQKKKSQTSRYISYK